VPVAIAAMKGDKHVAVEVSTAKTMEECREMVDTRGAWKTNKPVELTLKGGGTTGC